MALDEHFTHLVGAGTALAEARRDWTVHVDVAGLTPYTDYYYRFIAPHGQVSATGRTRTAPAHHQHMANLRFGVVSCSSIFSGYFNAYRHIALKEDIDAVIHLGDYIYNTVDPDEKRRLPHPYPQAPTTLAAWRARHQYYLLDPDLRLVRQRHPFIVLWDNHDLGTRGGRLDDGIQQAIQAFHEWVPIRHDPARPEVIYRTLRYGNLLDIILLDTRLYHDRLEAVKNAHDRTMLGAAQKRWLAEQLEHSQASWRLIGSQSKFGAWSFAGLYDFDPTSWDGYAGERRAILRHIRDATPGNTIVISGDAHISMAMDLPIRPFAPFWSAERQSRAVEFLPPSVTRGNGDEAGMPRFALRAAEVGTYWVNPHMRYIELTRHGYGLLDVRPDRVTAEFWYVPITHLDDRATFARGLVVHRGSNRWERRPTTRPTVPVALHQRVSNLRQGPARDPGEP
jgi:alkaline phosphatase D